MYSTHTLNNDIISVDATPSKCQSIVTQLNSHSFDSLLALYQDNYCACQNSVCKESLKRKFTSSLKQNLSSKVVRDLT